MLIADKKVRAPQCGPRLLDPAFHYLPTLERLIVNIISSTQPWNFHCQCPFQILKTWPKLHARVVAATGANLYT